jgi:hypothetical protein
MSLIIEDIRVRLAWFPQARLEQNAVSIACLPAAPDGFTVRLTVRKEVMQEWYSVYYNDVLYEQGTYRQAAMTTFFLGLSTGCRLREYSRSGQIYRQVIELWQREQQQWLADRELIGWSVAHLQFWRHPQIRCLQNRLIEPDERGPVPPIR